MKNSIVFWIKKNQSFIMPTNKGIRVLPSKQAQKMIRNIAGVL